MDLPERDARRSYSEDVAANLLLIQQQASVVSPVTACYLPENTMRGRKGLPPKARGIGQSGLVTARTDLSRYCRDEQTKSRGRRRLPAASTQVNREVCVSSGRDVSSRQKPRAVGFGKS